VTSLLLWPRAWLLHQSPAPRQLLTGLALASFLPLYFAYGGLLLAALPARVHWWASGFGVAASSLWMFGTLFRTLTFPERDASDSLGLLAAVALVLAVVGRQLALRAWRKLDWTFQPVRWLAASGGARS
jgi:hypothetical protein